MATIHRKSVNKRGIFRLLLSILITQAVGGLGSIFTVGAIKSWYPTLKKPSFNPPNSIFGPVWSVLFTLMGVSLFLVWRKKAEGKPGVDPALKVFGIQLGLNTLWTILFFGLKSPFYGLVDIAFLWVAILATIVAFSAISVPAALLLIPYILWVSFAAVLNFYIWRLNH